VGVTGDPERAGTSHEDSRHHHSRHGSKNERTRWNSRAWHNHRAL